MTPKYLTSYANGSLQHIAVRACILLESCELCPRKCRVNRLKDERGFCKTGRLAKVYSYMAHRGEEPPISGTRGSGTIFFSHCNMACLYCQNYEFSQLGQGKEVQANELAKFMLELQEMGCHNINLVTPTHVMAQVLEALVLAIPKGLRIPLVYNTSGYELPEIISLLEEVIDIYLPDLRYADADIAAKYSGAPSYPAFSQASVKEMHRQVGVAQMDEEGIITKGLIIRHLVLPHGLSGTAAIMKFIAEEISPDTYLSLMSQYLPYHKACAHQEISCRLTQDEYEAAKNMMERHGLHNGWVQESYGLERFAGVNIKPSLKKDP